MSRPVAPSIAPAASSSRDRCDWSRSSAARSPTPRTASSARAVVSARAAIRSRAGSREATRTSPGTTRPAATREGQQDPARDGIDPAQQHATEGDRARGRDRRDGDAGERLLQRPDVGRDAGEQVAAASRPEPGRGQRLDGGEERRSQVGEDAEGAGVDHDPLEVPRARAHDGQHPDRGDREREVGDVGDGLGAADEVGGGPDQRDVRDRRRPPRRWRRAAASRAWTPRARGRAAGSSPAPAGQRTTRPWSSSITTSAPFDERRPVARSRRPSGRGRAGRWRRRPTPLRRDRGGRSARRGRRGRRRAGTPARPRSAAAGRRSAGRRPRRSGVSRPSGRSSMNAVAPAARAAAATSSSGRVRPGQADVVGDGAVEQVGRLRDVRDPAAPGADVDDRRGPRRRR